MKVETFKIGDDVYVREPQLLRGGAACIVGTITAIHQNADGECFYSFVNEGHPATGKVVTFRASEIGIRRGTPISQLSGRPGHPGFEKWCAIARSWGYE